MINNVPILVVFYYIWEGREKVGVLKLAVGVESRVLRDIWGEIQYIWTLIWTVVVVV